MGLEGTTFGVCAFTGYVLKLTGAQDARGFSILAGLRLRRVGDGRGATFIALTATVRVGARRRTGACTADHNFFVGITFLAAVAAT